MVHGVFYVVWCGGRWCPLFLISNFPRCPPRAHVTWPVLPLLQRLLTIPLFLHIYGTTKLWTHSVVEHFLCYCSSAFLISVQFPRGGIGGSFDRFLSKTKQSKIEISGEDQTLGLKQLNEWGTKGERGTSLWYQVYNLKELDFLVVERRERINTKFGNKESKRLSLD